MGMNLHLRSSNKEIDEEYEKSGKRIYLNRIFSGFVFGQESYGQNCEFNQIEKLYEIELKSFRMLNYGGMHLYKEDLEGLRDWELSKTSNSIEIEKINIEYEQRLNTAKIQDIKELENNWVATSILKKTIEELINKINNNPELLENIEYGYFEHENFVMSKDMQKKGQYYILEDLEYIIEFINHCEQNNVNKVAFFEI